MTALVRARSITEALDAIADGEGHVLAGGQALTILLNEGFVDAARLVDLAGLDELRHVTRHPTHVRLGALCTHRTVGSDPTVSAAVPGLCGAFTGIGNIRVRAAGTLGGNLAHADPRQDPPPALMLLGAIAIVRGPDATREVPVADLIDGALSTTLGHGELITAVDIPVLGPQEWFGFSKFLAGSSEGFATANAALKVAWSDDGTVTRAEACLGAVGAVPRRVPLPVRGITVDDVPPDLAEAVACAVADGIGPTDGRRMSGDYLRALCGELVRGLLRDFAGASPTRRSA